MDETAGFKPLNPTAFRKPCGADSPVLTQTATQAALLLLSCYRAGEANNPEIYTDAVISVLAEYPTAIIRRVVDPRHGLPSRSQFLPTIAEVKNACEAEMAPQRREDERQKRIEDAREFLGDSRVSCPVRSGQSLKEMGLTLAEFTAKYGRPLGPNEVGTRWERFVGYGRQNDFLHGPLDEHPPAVPSDQP